MVEETTILSTPCTQMDLKKIGEDYLITYAIAQMEGAVEEVQRRGLGHLLPESAR